MGYSRQLNLTLDCLRYKLGVPLCVTILSLMLSP